MDYIISNHTNSDTEQSFVLKVCPMFVVPNSGPYFGLKEMNLKQ